ncbi:DUF58 domain-containing protein [Salaquimonas pukyongi]|uniref:DUF58 domain-containing protein n=1 Tax=Salaquimonas pukyongi TaxID=2712698 RepID=UPI00096B98E9|nr:DUF58 domain-containing protein [Salaquimonas pukyongi]
MSQTTGKLVDALQAQTVLARSRARAALIPDLLVEAHRVANNVFAGWHGRRRRGIGENFWQFRPYVQGENLAAIDWRRSARDDHVYIKDREWQASHTIWLWVDESPSMLYQSSGTEVSKQSRALVLALAMAELLARSGERIGWLGVSKPIVHRHAAERLANDLLVSGAQETWPDMKRIGDHAEVILFSDFLESREDEEAHLAVFRDLSNKRVRGHLVQIVDPAEEVFSYSGRMEFRDPETGHRLNLGAAQTVKQDYEALFRGHTRLLADYCARLGWSHTLHHTDRLASLALQSLHIALSENAFDGGG